MDKLSQVTKLNSFNPLNEPTTNVRIKKTYISKLKKLAISHGVGESRMLELLVMKATS